MQLLSKFLIVRCSLIDRVYRKDGEIYMKIKFEFLGDDILLAYGQRYESVPGDEEVLSLSQVKGVDEVVEACILVKDQVAVNV